MANSISDEEDITLQDLIAVETIDESQMPADDDDDDDEDGGGAITGVKDDLSWTNQLSLDSFQYISQVLGYGGPFRCEECGLRYGSLNVYRAHRGRCRSSGGNSSSDAVHKETLGVKTGSGPSGVVKTTASSSVLPSRLEKIKSEASAAAKVKMEEDSSSVPAKSPVKEEGVVKSEPTVAGQVSSKLQLSDPASSRTSRWQL
jgi:hypothetical protein